MLRFSSTAQLAWYTTNAVPLHSMVSRYLRERRIDEARHVFDQMSNPDVYLYTNLINGYLRNNRLHDALEVFEEMPMRDTAVWNLMMRGYLDCGGLSMAREMFDRMPERNVVSWTTMFTGYLKFGMVEVAKELFEEMPCADVAAWNAMISGYFGNGKVDDAIELFEKMPSKNIISWTSAISGLDQNGRSGDALALFPQLIHSMLEPTVDTLSCVITACGNALALEQGMQVHARILASGFFLHEFVSTSLITFYSKCRRLDDFLRVFDDQKLHDNVVVWTCLLSAYNLNSKHEDSLCVFRDMMARAVVPNQFTFSSSLNSCCELVAIDRGKAIHGVAIKLRLQRDVSVCNSLVVLYSKCGSIQDGVAAFLGTSGKNLVSWNSMIVGCAQHGCGRWVLSLFAQMIRANEEPDEITFTGLLYACSHSGMLSTGRSFYHYLSRYKSMEMKLEHYACMVDIMGRSGELEEAEEFINNLPVKVKANSMVWLALLSASKTHSNLEMAERAARRVLDLEPAHCSAAYTLLSNVYASASRWNDVSRIRWEMKRRGTKKQQGGCS
ncbi:hypothetical protein Dimus_033148 [Dionaea muscipula]